MMAGLITGSFGAPADLAEQRHFFDTHIGCWAPRFFEDLQAAQSAVLYMPVGTIGRLFLAVEAEAFDMAAAFVFFIGFKIAFEPFHMTVAFEGEDVGRKAIEEEAVEIGRAHV